MKQPTEGGSYVYDPKKDELKQVEKPTEHVGPNDRPAAEAEAQPSPGEQSVGSAGKGK